MEVTKGIYHLVGAGGIGMSGLARLLLCEGARVSGSDQSDSPILRQLGELGMATSVGHTVANVPEQAIVVQSDAISDDNPEVAIARSRGQRVWRRSRLLGALMEGRDGIGVTGTHGKTTTTAMIARILLEAGLDPSVVVGGEALGPEGNAHAGTGRYFVAEACEAFEAYLDLAPRIGVVTNIEADHLHYHRTPERYVESFRRFISAIETEGVLIANADEPRVMGLAGERERGGGRVEAYGLTAGRWRAENVEQDGIQMTFDVLDGGRCVGRVRLCTPGRHNVSNAMAAIAAAHEAGVPAEQAAAALETYRGVKRRFERLGERDGVIVFDDYAHHPTEVAAVLAGARGFVAGEGDRRVIAVFQPHLFSRTRDHLAGFIAAFDDADVVLITDIYAAREKPIESVSSSRIVEGLRDRTPDKELWYVPALADLPAAMSSVCRSGDVAVVIGAGNIRQAGEQFIAEGGAR